MKACWLFQRACDWSTKWALDLQGKQQVQLTVSGLLLLLFFFPEMYNFLKRLWVSEQAYHSIIEAWITTKTVRHSMYPLGDKQKLHTEEGHLIISKYVPFNVGLINAPWIEKSYGYLQKSVLGDDPDIEVKQERLKGWNTFKNNEKIKEDRNCQQLQNLKENSQVYDPFLAMLQIQSLYFSFLPILLFFKEKSES